MREEFRPVELSFWEVHDLCSMIINLWLTAVGKQPIEAGQLILLAIKAKELGIKSLWLT